MCMCVCACVCLCVLYLVRCDLYVWFLFTGKGLTAYFFTGGWKPCIPGSEYHCYPITTDSG